MSLSLSGLSLTSTFEYDNAPNPLLITYKVPALFFCFYPSLSTTLPSYTTYSGYVPTLFSSNNITKITTTMPLRSNFVVVQDITYTYGTKGYPVTAVQKVSVNGVDQGTTNTFSYQYNNCQ